MKSGVFPRGIRLARHGRVRASILAFAATLLASGVDGADGPKRDCRRATALIDALWLARAPAAEAPPAPRASFAPSVTPLRGGAAVGVAGAF
jgi:hypothetical protein